MKKSVIERTVSKIIEDVRRSGDKALFAYTKKFDKVSLTPRNIKVSQREFDEALEVCDWKFLIALRKALKNIKAYHEKQKPDKWFTVTSDEVVLGQRNIPLDAVGLYVPGGRAAYPSSVLMNAVPAAIAGVSRIVMVTPPGKDGKINPHVLVAAKEAGIAEVYKIGGAQAVAALAFGTRSVPRVDKIVGPGNIFVTTAKKLLYGTVGIDKLAGPSDVVIIADQTSDVRFIAADMAAQTEHDPMSTAVLISVSKEIIRDTKFRLKKDKALRNCSFIYAKSLKEAVETANDIAPEHLELVVASPQKLLEDVRNAGAVFLGPYSPVAVGDYIAGPNHVLPTDGSARFSSPLGVYDFVKKQSVIGYNKQALSKVADDVVKMADIEGLKKHAGSIKVRFD